LKILVTGRNGQVGAELATLLPRLGDVLALDRSELDLANPAQVREVIHKQRPDVILNAAAYTAVDLAEKEGEQARIINVQAPALLAEEAKKIGALLVHYSTDYVFDGSKNSPYLETDPTNPKSAYGKTKLAGEQVVCESGADFLIFRTAWVYGTRGRNFLLTILRLAAERDELRIVRDQIGAPTWSREIARGTAGVLAKVFGQSSGARTQMRGTYHMTAAGEASWFEFAQAILAEAAHAPKGTSWTESATKGRPFVAQRVVPISTTEYPTPASRPAYSVLSNAKLSKDFGVTLPTWSQQLREVFTTR
jgi:dTDP-4-dehydrorhamnose reductase